MSKSVRRLLLVVVALLLIGVAGLYVTRLALLDWALRSYLEDQGVSQADFTVLEVDPDRLVIRDIAIGGDQVVLALLHLRFQLFDLIGGHVDQVFLDGLKVKLDLTGDGPPLGRLQRLLDSKDRERDPSETEASGDADETAALQLPTITIQNSALLAETAVGSVEVLLEGEVWENEAGLPEGALSYDAQSASGMLKGLVALSGQAGGRVLGNVVVDEGRLTLPQASANNILGGGAFQWGEDLKNLDLVLELAMTDLVLQSEGLPAPPFERAQGSLILEEGNARVVVDLTEAGNGMQYQLFAEAEHYRNAPEVALTSILEVPAGSDVWSALGMTIEEDGQLRLDLHATGQIDDVENALETAMTDPWNLVAGELAFDGSLVTNRISVPDVAGGLEAHVALAGTLVGRRLAVSLDPSTEVTLQDPAETLLDSLGIDPSFRGMLKVVTVKLDQQGGARLAFAPLGEGYDLQLSGGASLTSGQGTKAELQGKTQANLGARYDLKALGQTDFTADLRNLRWQEYRIATASLSGSLIGPVAEIVGRADLRASLPGLAVGGVDTRGVEVTVASDITLAPGELGLDLNPTSSLSISELVLPEGIRVQRPLEARVRGGTIALAKLDADRFTLGHNLILDVGANDLLLPREDAEPLMVALEPGPIKLQGSMTGGLGYALKAEMADSNVMVPELGLEARGAAFQGEVNPGLNTMGLAFAVDVVSDNNESPRFAPVMLDGNLVRTAAETFHLSAKGGWPDAPGAVAVEADLNASQGRGAADIIGGPLVFSPGGLQPSALSPMAADLAEVSGSAEAEARVTWSAEGLASNGTLTVQDLTFTSQDTKVTGLNLTLALSDLLPLTSAPGQLLTIGSIDPGLPVEDLALTFEIQPSDLPVMAVEGGRFNLLGGQFAIEPTVLDPATEAHDLTFEIRNLTLEALFETLEFDGVTGQGALDGRIPIHIEDGKFAIADGRLAARGPGRLQFRSDEAEELLGDQDDNVDSMLDALKDFYFEEFSVGLEKTTSEDLDMALSVLGSNPKVLDGQQFRINVNLETNIGNILSALSQGLDASGDRIREIWRGLR